MSQAFTRLEQKLDALHPGWDEDRAVVKRAVAQSEAFTGDVGVRRTVAMMGQDLVAYLAYFVPRGVAAAQRVIPPALKLNPPGRVIDWGAGVGTASLVIAEHTDAKLLLVDVQQSALDVAAGLLGGRPIDRLDRLPRRLRAGDLIVASFSFAEMVHSQSFDDVAGPLLRAAEQGAALVLIDGGDRKSARPVQTLRDQLVEAGISVAAPCPHDDRCPALVRDKDWCHTRVSRDLPPRFAAFAQRVGRDPEMMSFSYLVTGPRPAEGSSVRVLGAPKNEKGRVRLPVCGPASVRFIQAKKRDKVAARSLVTLSRGSQPDVDVATARGDTIHIVDEATAKAAGVFP